MKNKDKLDFINQIVEETEKQLSIHVVVKSFVCPNGCGKNGDMGSCIECVGK